MVNKCRKLFFAAKLFFYVGVSIPHYVLIGKDGPKYEGEIDALLKW